MILYIFRCDDFKNAVISESLSTYSKFECLQLKNTTFAMYFFENSAKKNFVILLRVLRGNLTFCYWTHFLSGRLRFLGPLSLNLNFMSMSACPIRFPTPSPTSTISIDSKRRSDSEHFFFPQTFFFCVLAWVETIMHCITPGIVLFLQLIIVVLFYRIMYLWTFIYQINLCLSFVPLESEQPAAAESSNLSAFLTVSCSGLAAIQT